MRHKPKTHKGLTLLSIVLSIGLFGIIIPSLFNAIMGANTTINDLTQEFEANAIMTQTIQALQSIQAQNFTNLTTGTHGLTTGSGYWQLSGSSDTIDSKYTREVTIASGGTDIVDISIQIYWTNLVAVNRDITHSITLTNWY